MDRGRRYSSAAWLLERPMLLACAIRDHVRAVGSPRRRIKIDDAISSTNKLHQDSMPTRLLPDSGRPVFLARLRRRTFCAGGPRSHRAEITFAQFLTALATREVTRPATCPHRPGLPPPASPRDHHRRSTTTTPTGSSSRSTTPACRTQADLLRNYLFMQLPASGSTCTTRSGYPCRPNSVPTAWHSGLARPRVARTVAGHGQPRSTQAQQRRLGRSSRPPKGRAAGRFAQAASPRPLTYPALRARPGAGSRAACRAASAWSNGVEKHTTARPPHPRPLDRDPPTAEEAVEASPTWRASSSAA